jgi:hypothetical protein
MSHFAKAFNKEPAMAIAGLVAFGALVLPYAVVPLRRAWGLPTYQWDADPASHPFLNHFGDNYKPHDFSDPQLLTRWGKLGEYRYTGRLPAVGKEDAEAQEGGSRDFPEARARLQQKGLL